MTDTQINNEESLTYCAVHPDRETGLRCITCNRYMCVDCAVRTPVGYRCRECVRGQQQVFFKGTQTDDILTFSINAVLSGIAIGILAAVNLTWILIAIVVGLPLGAGISELGLRATQRRRSRYSHYIAAAGAVIGGLVGVLLPAAIRYSSLRSPRFTLPEFLMQSLTADIGAILLIVIVAIAVYGRYRMKM